MLRYRPRRWLVHLALAFGAGVYLGGGVAFHWIWLAAAFCCVLCALLLRRMSRSVYLPLLGLAVALGLLRCAVTAYPALPEEGAYAVTAVIDSAPTVREQDGRVAVFLRDLRLPGDPQEYRAYWTYWPENDAPLPLEGQTAVFSGRVYHPAGSAQAQALEQRLQSVQREDPFAQYMLGAEAERAGQLQQAIRYYRQAVRLYDTAHQFHFGLARVYFLAGQLKHADRELLRAQELGGAPQQARYQAKLDSLARWRAQQQARR